MLRPSGLYLEYCRKGSRKDGHIIDTNENLSAVSMRSGQLGMVRLCSQARERAVDALVYFILGFVGGGIEEQKVH